VAAAHEAPPRGHRPLGSQPSASSTDVPVAWRW
jgi:hypothetical protein